MLDSSFNEWAFIRVHFWGERAASLWKLEILKNRNQRASKAGILRNWQTVIYGTILSPVWLRPPTSSAKPTMIPVATNDRDVLDGMRRNETTEQDRSIPSYPPKVYDQEAATAAPTSAVCSTTGTSEIGSVFGLRFDPQENKMTLQLTAVPNDLPSSRSPAYRKVVEVSNHQPSRYTFYSLNRFRVH